MAAIYIPRLNQLFRCSSIFVVMPALTPTLRNIFLAALAVVTLGRAQDVTVGGILWAGTGPAPDKLPALKRSWVPEYPDEMLNVNASGYVLISQQVDASGKTHGLSVMGSHLPFQRAVETALIDWKVSPAEKAG